MSVAFSNNKCWIEKFIWEGVEYYAPHTIEGEYDITHEWLTSLDEAKQYLKDKGLM